VHVQVGAADRGGGDPYDDVVRRLDPGILHLGHLDLVRLLVDHCLHRSTSSQPASAAWWLNCSTRVRQNAGRSFGPRLVIRMFGPWSQTRTSSSTQVPPELRMSVRRLGHEVRVRPRTTPASTSIQGAWQITAAGLPLSTISRTNRTARWSMRSRSGFATPPGSTSAA